MSNIAFNWHCLRPRLAGNTVTGAGPVCLPHIAIKPFGPMLTPADKLALGEVITLITDAMPVVKYT